MMSIKEENYKLFHAILENEAVNKLAYGSVTISIEIKDGNPLIQTMRIDRMKRKKYPI